MTSAPQHIETCSTAALHSFHLHCPEERHLDPQIPPEVNELELSFLSFVAQELRTPLTWMSIVDSIGSADPPGRTREMLTIARRGHRRLKRLVEQLQHYLEVKAMPPSDTRETVVLNEVVDQVLDRFEARAGDGVLLERNLGELPLRVRGTQSHIGEILDLLLDHAATCSSRKREIRIDVMRAHRAAQIAVSDNGWGFPSADAERMFQPFPLHETSNHSTGTGLSLAVARRLAELHGGTLRAVSLGWNTGVLFIVELPWAVGGDVQGHDRDLDRGHWS